MTEPSEARASKLTTAQWAEGIGLLIVSALIIIVALVALGAFFHARFLIFGGAPLGAAIAYGLQRLLSKLGLSTLDKVD